MARSNNQKGKILYLERLLQATGEGRGVSMQEILAELLKYGIVAERKSIYDDLDVLRSFGMDIRYRRGKPGGYYLGGNQERPFEAPEKLPQLRDTEAPEQEREKSPVTEEGSRIPGFCKEAGEEGRELRLICQREKEGELRAIFGDCAQYKEKGPDFITVTLKLLEGPEFYGWLTSMGKAVHIQKPKKAALAYREYLKEIARDYKGI